MLLNAWQQFGEMMHLRVPGLDCVRQTAEQSSHSVGSIESAVFRFSLAVLPGLESRALQSVIVLEESKPFGESGAAYDPMLECALEHRFRSRVGLHLPDGRNASDGGHHRPVKYYPIDESTRSQQTVERVDGGGLQVEAGVVELESGLHQGLLWDRPDVPWRQHRHWPRPDPLASGMPGRA
eukprot:6207682-Pleurochrysis_carterae.AAC.1